MVNVPFDGSGRCDLARQNCSRLNPSGSALIIGGPLCDTGGRTTK